jgi:hypothetical protein
MTALKRCVLKARQFMNLNLAKFSYAFTRRE